MLRILLLGLLLLSPLPATALDDATVAAGQKRLAALPLNARIAHWAERFVGTPYDQDPLGNYVRKEKIVVDESMDCMYHVFRSVELARSSSPQGAVAEALELRFHHRGVVENGRVANYDDRFEYGEEMLRSGKWGRDVTAELGPTVEIPGARGVASYRILAKEAIPAAMERMLDGDMIFWIKEPERRVRGEVVGHLGIIAREGKQVWLLHAGGTKKRGGAVRKVPLEEFLETMPFIGAMVGRF